MKKLCGLFGKSRQAWYERCWRVWDGQLHEKVVLDLIQEITQGFQMGIHNLYPVLKPKLVEMGIKMGRAKVQVLRKKHGLSVIKKRRKVKTTDSSHHFRKWTFLAEGLVPDRSEVLWVSDITYIRVHNGFGYLSLITDAYSRKIVGYHLSKDLTTRSSLIALNMALEGRKYPERSLIHHSDRGVQYCSFAYIRTLKDANVNISMGRKGQVLDNAIAERINGILKGSYYMDQTFKGYKVARIAVDAAIYHYNHVKPHSSIEWLRPAESHSRIGHLARKWANNYKPLNEKSQQNPDMTSDSGSP